MKPQAHYKLLLGCSILSLLVFDSPALAQLVHCAVTPVSFDVSRVYTDANGPTGVAIGDFNHDLKIDLATSENGAQKGVGFLENVTPAMGVPAWQAPTHQQTYAGAGNLLAISPATIRPPLNTPSMDLNHDGIADVAISDDNGLVWVSVGNAANPLKNFAKFAVNGDEQDISYGDFNGDGWFDLVTADGTNITASILINKLMNPVAFKPFSTVAETDGPGPSVVVADFNCDGKDDIATVAETAGEIDIFYGNGLGGFAPAIQIGVPPNEGGIAAGDFNCDGAIDLAVAGGGGIIVTYNNRNLAGVPTCGQWVDSATNLPEQINVGNGAEVAAADVNGDGVTDLISAAGSAAGGVEVEIFRSQPVGACGPNIPNHFFAPVILLPPSGGAPTANGLAIGDLNGDGKLDIALANNGNMRNVNVLLNTCN